MLKILFSLVLISASAHAETIKINGQYCEIHRDKHHKIKRSSKAVREFKRTHICPGTGRIEKHCKGYVVDHVLPLCACGADTPNNMQYQTIKDSLKKDILERRACAR